MLYVDCRGSRWNGNQGVWIKRACSLQASILMWLLSTILPNSELKRTFSEAWQEPQDREIGAGTALAGRSVSSGWELLSGVCHCWLTDPRPADQSSQKRLMRSSGRSGDRWPLRASRDHINGVLSDTGQHEEGLPRGNSQLVTTNLFRPWKIPPLDSPEGLSIRGLDLSG